MYRPASISAFVPESGAGSARAMDGDLPPEAPLAMPVQSFAHAPSPCAASLPSEILGRRIFLVLGCVTIGSLCAQ